MRRRLCGLLLSGAILAQPVQAAPLSGRYVAMGSSYAAGPGITTPADRPPTRCARSQDNYAHQVARRLGLDLVDVSCSGATTADLLGPWRELPAQVDAVTRDTRWVTITIGGNDVSYMKNLIALGCDEHTRLYLRLLGACRVSPDAQVEENFTALPGRLTRIAAEVHRRAPKARLIFVNYFTVLPESGTCDRLGLSSEAADRMRIVARRLADLTHGAALSNHAELLDLASLSASHNVCAADPWLLGMHPERFFAAPLHPNLEGMQGAADALDQRLEMPVTAQPS